MSLESIKKSNSLDKILAAVKTETAPVEPAKTTEAVADAPVETPKSGDSGQRAEDILAMIRSRQK